ncbi:MAG TPA: agmatine deiminase family protein [Spirochaetia bacterium]|nr:agmatine deiminase family protein [Spirochaetia bacterium]
MKKPDVTEQVPARLGFRMPAEWETHEATWLAWPRRRSDWPGKTAPIPWVFGEIVRKIVPGEKIRILVRSADHEKGSRRVLVSIGVMPREGTPRIEMMKIPTDRAWARDFGPIFIRREEPKRELAVAGFRFNAWARYPDWRLDTRAAKRIARALKRAYYPVRRGGKDVVLEGGSIDVNGRGSLLTTEECLLDKDVQVRNPCLDRRDLEAIMKDYLGVSNVLWLGRGIAGDDTHGHVDDICRFVSPGAVVLCSERDPSDANYRALEENRERLEGCRLEDGSRIQTVLLPMPAPLFMNGQRLPASYANFYISNAAVLVPTFNDPSDRRALGILAELFPDRTVVGIHAVDLVWGLGTLHCLTQQEPSEQPETLNPVSGGR